MREASLEDITKFLECKRLALVGVSRKPQHFSRMLMREFIAQGYDPIPVNPQATEMEGRKCCASLADVSPPVEAALLMTGSSESSDRAVRDCHAAGVQRIWIYKEVHDGQAHEKAIDTCRVRGTAIIEGYCPMMFLPKPGMVHRLHRFIMKISGSYPL
ncbi:MAG TPA: CoA-binding protein [Terriglobia bacterium]|nr:CoA-binding protein [Terriglobia bacterium]